jgi:hypothetical protein
VVFHIGCALKGRVDLKNREICWRSLRDFDQLVEPASVAVSFYDAQLHECRRAVNAWSIVGLRFGVVKDIRKLIGRLIWDAREEANYAVDVDLGRTINLDAS